MSLTSYAAVAGIAVAVGAGGAWIAQQDRGNAPGSSR